MKLFELYGTDKNDMQVIVGLRSMSLGEFRERVQSITPYDVDGSSSWMAFSNTGVLQLMFRGVKSAGVLYMYEIRAYSNTMFTEWRALTRELGVQMIDIACAPHDLSSAKYFKDIGFRAVSKRLSVQVLKHYEPVTDASIVPLESLTLTQTEDVCYLMRPTLKDAGTREMLGEMANGFVTASVSLENDKPFSMLLYKEVGDIIVAEQFCCVTFEQTRLQHEFMKHYQYLLALAKQHDWTVNIGVPFENELPQHPAIQYQVLSHHYTIV